MLKGLLVQFSFLLIGITICANLYALPEGLKIKDKYNCAKYNEILENLPVENNFENLKKKYLSEGREKAISFLDFVMYNTAYVWFDLKREGKLDKVKEVSAQDIRERLAVYVGICKASPQTNMWVAMQQLDNKPKIQVIGLDINESAEKKAVGERSATSLPLVMEPLIPTILYAISVGNFE